MTQVLRFALAAAVALYTSASSTAATARAGYRSVDIGAGCALVHSPPQQRIQRPTGDSIIELKHPGAHFLELHFSFAHLPPGAAIAVVDLQTTALSADEKTKRRESHESTSEVLQRYDLASIPATSFTTSPIYSAHIAIRYTAGGNSSSKRGNDGTNQSHSDTSITDCFGFHIDELRFEPKSFSDRPSTYRSKGASAIGSGDNCASADDPAVDAACMTYDAAVLEASRPVARLLIQKRAGAIFCTGWLLGCEGHVLSNHHCVAVEGESDSSAVAIEFMAQGASCAQACDAPSLCPGRTVTLLADIVAFSPESELDYVLLKPRLSPAQLQALVADYGFLSLRAGGAVLGEEIFIPQHPAGYGKRIALKHAGSYGSVTSLNETSCNTRSDNLGYLMGTLGGSSGAPVVATGDLGVVGLHFCGGCPNSAIPSQEIVRSLAAVNALPACAISELGWPAA